MGEGEGGGGEERREILRYMLTANCSEREIVKELFETVGLSKEEKKGKDGQLLIGCTERH